MGDQTVSVKHGWIIIFLLNSENGLRNSSAAYFFAKRFSSRGGERGLPSAIHPPRPCMNREGLFLRIDSGAGRLIYQARSDILKEKRKGGS